MATSLLSSAPVRWALSSAIAGYMALVHRTTRWTVEGEAHLRAARASSNGIIGGFWHNRLMQAALVWPKDAQKVQVLVSKSAHGDIIAAAAAKHGVGAARGSSFNMKKRRDKGALSAFKTMVRHLREGGCVAISPDGPRGPRMRLQEGIVALAQVTGAPLIFVGWSTTAQIRFNSWDQFVLPLPFGRGRIVWSPLMTAPDRTDDAATEAFRQKAEAVLNAVTAQADAGVGCTPMQPADTEGADA